MAAWTAAGTLARFIGTVQTFGDESLKALLTDGPDQVR
jgi:hypothetical protein